MMAVAVLLFSAAPKCNDLWRIKLVLQGGSLAGITKPKDLFVSALAVHLCKCISNVGGGYLFPILKLHKLVATVSSEKDENVAH
eukprot:CAMPEP_0172759792 /NCGR_PEP_ID=MMETSP1074-20121228/168383_1 /TAXON_ID=2916 /ORGANISM="Ceratium fusus, Strain PA161109" /LENGTH=83 /DNA_ID=CAMNT_0013593669 /DNA_START=146 /DNA_END=397 /DNA_ORIENTATION=-